MAEHPFTAVLRPDGKVDPAAVRAYVASLSRKVRPTEGEPGEAARAWLARQAANGNRHVRPVTP